MTTKVPFQLLANGTAGELITWSAAGAPDVIAAGASGQVLTSNGAGAAATFQAAGGGSSAGLTTIVSGNLATGSPTVVDITSIPQTYRGLILKVSGASNTVATRGLMVELDAGLGLGNANNLGSWKQITGSTVTEADGSNRTWTAITQTAATMTSCILEIFGYQSGTVKQYKGIVQAGFTPGDYYGAADTMFFGTLIAGTQIARTGAITGIRMTWDNVATGVFDGGTYTLYGVN
jgi:hypothetical protein